MRVPGRTIAIVAAMFTGLVGSAAFAASGVGIGVATVGRTAERITPPTVDPPRPVLLVSDSAWLGIKTYGAIDAVQGVDHVLDLASCRRRVAPSCRNYDGHVPITVEAELDAHGRGFHTLVVATGYNDSDHDFLSDVQTLVVRARELGYQRIVWLTLRANVTYQSPDASGYDRVFIANNVALHDLVDSGAYPELVVADWATYARDRPAWFSADGIHLRGTGPWAAADYISRKLAALDDRACPMPADVGAIRVDPCPDPDAGPPDVDLAGIYPIGAPGNPTAGFFMEFEGSGSWPEPPWWSR